MAAKDQNASASQDLLNNSQAILNNEEAEGVRISNALEAIELDREQHRLRFERSCDFEECYYVFDDDVGQSSVTVCKNTLRRMARLKPKCAIVMELNSGGGSIIDGFALIDELNRMRRLGHHITIRVQGQAASMACVILQAADKREIGASSFLMIHRAAFGAMGKSYEVEDTVEFVRKLEHNIASIFATASKRPIEDFQEFFDKRADIWFDAEGALANGLVDEIV